MSTTSTYQAKFKYSGAVAAQYDQRRTANPKWQREQDGAKQLIQRFDSGASVLDVPLGTGRFLPFYAQRDLKVIGLDISVDMLTQARRLHEEGVANTSMVQGDSEALPLRGNSVDYVVCARLLNWVPPSVLGIIIGEFARVARKAVVVEIRLHETITAYQSLLNFKKELKELGKIDPGKVRRMLRGRGMTSGYVLHDDSRVTELFARHHLRLLDRLKVDERTYYLKRDLQPYYMYYLEISNKTGPGIVEVVEE